MFDLNLYQKIDKYMLRSHGWRYGRFLLLWFCLVGLFLAVNRSTAAPPSETFTVVVTLHEAESLTHADGLDGLDDIYFRAYIRPAAGVPLDPCGNEDMADVDVNHIFPEWKCTRAVTLVEDDVVEIRLQLWDDDAWFNGLDDFYDIYPVPERKEILMFFDPRTSDLQIVGDPDWTTPHCAIGGLAYAGNEDVDQARVRFSVSTSLSGDPSGDSDGDGFLDSWELCGVDTNGDNVKDIDLPAMGANPLRPDVFVEMDWMILDGIISHEPWLPSLISAWNEFNVAPVANPDGSNGIALHVDVGNLYENYSIDHGPGSGAEINVATMGIDADGIGGPESLDLNGDGIPDIGALGALGNGTLGGGNRVTPYDDAITVTPFCGSGTEIATIVDDPSNFHPSRQGIFYYALSASRFDIVANDDSGVACPAAHLFLITLGGALSSDLSGPSGLPVKGRIDQHTAVFMHELGHLLQLEHYGDDPNNYYNFKPNYLSIMNDAFPLGISFSYPNPDGTLDTLTDDVRDNGGSTIDFDMDGVPDTRRFTYSDDLRPTLDEACAPAAGDTNCLDEAIGIRLGENHFKLTRVGPGFLDIDGDGVNDCFPIMWQMRHGDQSIDWNRDSDTVDFEVDELASPPNPSGIPTDINCLPGTTLAGFNDYAFLQNNGLAIEDLSPSVEPMPSPEDGEALERNTASVTALPDEDFLLDRCEPTTLDRVTFEEYPEGTVISTQYAPLATFSTTEGEPTLVGPGYRGGRPTQSPDNSLANVPPPGMNTFKPLMIAFGEPQRLAGFYFGHLVPSGTDTIVVTAYDGDGYAMGTVHRPLPDADTGITDFLGLGAIFPERPISRLEIDFQGTSDEPVQMDELILCQIKRDEVPPELPPPPPAFGNSPVNVNVEAEVVTVGPGATTDTVPKVHSPITGVPVVVDGATSLTHFTFYRREGSTVELSAPLTVATSGRELTFLHWVMNDRVIFPDDEVNISLRLLRNATFKAVYADLSDNCHLIVEATFDANDTDPGDGVCVSGQGLCTLRAAVEEANALPEACIITVPEGVYQLQFPGTGEDAALVGDLDITDDVTILGAGAEETIVDGMELDTVFDILPGVTVDMRGLTIQNGLGSGYPGGLDNDGILSTGSCIIRDNVASGSNAGGVWNSGDMTMRNCQILNNTASLNGGGIFNSFGDLSIYNSVISGNEAQTFNGGGLDNNGGTVFIQSSTLADNVASSGGGGIYSDASLTLSNSTLSQNTAAGAGGLVNSGATDVNNVTIADNHSEGTIAGGVDNAVGTFTFSNSIIADNTGEGGGAGDCRGVLTSTGYNLVEDDTDCAIVGDTTGNLIGLAPYLSPLADNGGFAPTQALLSISPAVEAGNPATSGRGSPACELSDQRGVTRPSGSQCDMGAFEVMVIPRQWSIYLPVILR